MGTQKLRHFSRSRRTLAVLAALSVATVGALSSCATKVSGTADQVTLRYWLWDSGQLPGYRQCAADFEEQNPNVHIQIEQYGWDDYWTQITASMVAENAPDVFTDHTAQFGKYASLGQLLDIQPYVDSEGLDLSSYAPDLADQWLSADGTQRYGLPKDWDTEALFYNEDMVKDAGYAPEDLWKLEWNPTDGGSFEKFLAHLTVDANGVRGDEEGFDKNNVKVYGIGYNDAGSGYGQVQWSPYALSNGHWTWTDKNPWGQHFNYDAPEFQESITWWRSLIEKGYMPPLSVASSGIGTIESLGSGAYATLVEGSWNITNIATTTELPIQVAPTPIGPDGQRASVMNGLADSVWIGTSHPEESWRWVKYLGSAQCQDVIAEQGTVFPAIMSSTEKAIKTFEDMGIDARAFSVHVEEGTAVPSPVADRWAQVESLMKPAMSAVIAFEDDPSALTDANNRVNTLMSSNRDDE